jgi:hypothetical protein
MGYVVGGVIVLVLVAGFVAFLVINAARRSPQRAPDDPGAERNPMGIIASDEAPAGDTTEHAGAQRGGETIADPEGRDRGSAPPGDGRDAPQPESERLANRPR